MDNLKLGYGGTASEMYRLMQRAAELDETFAKTANFSIDSKGHLEAEFADITQAIHIVQTEMGITGTTALEAGRTISGSVGSMKSAWTNLITGIADDNADFGVLIDNFVTTIVGDGTENNLGVFGNLLPRIEIALDGTVKLIEGLFPKIIDILPGLLDSLLPSVIAGAVNIVSSFVNSISENKDLLVKTAFDSITVFIKGILSLLPDVVKLGFDLIISLANGLSENIPKLVPVAIDAVLKLTETLTDPTTLSNLMDAALILIQELADGLIEFIPELVSSATEIITKLFEFLTDPELLIEITNAAIDILEELAFSLIEAIPQLVDSAIKIIENLVVFLTDEETLKNLLDAAVDIILTLVNAILNNLDPLLDAAIGAIEALVMFLLDPEVLGQLAAAALDIIFALAAGLVSSVWKLIEAANELGTSIGEELKNMDWKKWGEDLMASLLEGIKAAWDAIAGWFSDAWNSITSLFSGAADAKKAAEDAVSYSKEQIDAANEELNNFKNSVSGLETTTPTTVPVNTNNQDAPWNKKSGDNYNFYLNGSMTPEELLSEFNYNTSLKKFN